MNIVVESPSCCCTVHLEGPEEPCLEDGIGHSQNWQLIKMRVPESRSVRSVLIRQRIGFIGACRRFASTVLKVLEGIRIPDVGSV
eukprot:6196708-Pleurochrysis_carterae.AAC.5